LPITTDGLFGDWKKAAPLHVDAVGDGGPSEIDFTDIFVANDEEALFIRFDVGRETILQNGPNEAAGNDLRLLLDLDDSAATGNPVEGIGAEIEIRFGRREITVFDESGSATNWTPEPLGVMALPTHSSTAFELRLPFTAARSAPIADRLRAGGSLAFVLEQTSGDRQPDSGAITYEISTDRVKPVKPKKLAKKRARYLRLLTMNVERTNLMREPDTYRRILRAVQPNVIAFQEVYDWSAAPTRRFVDETLPLENGQTWDAFQVGDTVTVSSHPIVAGAAIDENQVVLIDLPDARTRHDLVLFNAHTPCCDQNASRDAEHDNLAATWRDLLEGTGPFPIQPHDMVVINGDLNMVGYRRQLDVLLDGRFIDANNGPDFSPGRARGSLKSVPLRHTHRRLVHTWRNPGSPFAPGKLDFVIYSRDVARVKKSFTLDTAELPATVLETAGLEAGDSAVASTHLALVTDFKIRKK
jgi:endonuclease/exonuclease/phosphatase family metal-dependent hydrolase